MNAKTLQRWRMNQIGPEYLKLGKHVRYPLEAIAEYENQTRANVAFRGAKEILLYLQQTGQATIEQIRGACLGGKKPRHQIHTDIYRLMCATPDMRHSKLNVCLNEIQDLGDADASHASNSKVETQAWPSTRVAQALVGGEQTFGSPIALTG